MDYEKHKKHVKARYPAKPPENPAGAQQAVITRGVFADRAREEFFNEAFGDILSDLFVEWCKTETHCTKEREFLYATAAALGSVKGKLIDYSNLGKNTQYFVEQAAKQPDTSIQEGTEDVDQTPS